MNLSGGETSAPSAAFTCQRRPSQETAYTVYLPGPFAPIAGAASCPPGHSVSPLGPLPPGAQILSKCFFHSWVPVAAPSANKSSDTPATIKISLVPPLLLTPVAIIGGSRLCISRGTLSSFVFQRSFMFRTLFVLNDLSFLSQPVRPLSPPSIR